MDLHRNRLVKEERKKIINSGNFSPTRHETLGGGGTRDGELHVCVRVRVRESERERE